MTSFVRLRGFVGGAGAIFLGVALIVLLTFFANVNRNASDRIQTDGIIAFSGEPRRFAVALSLLADQRAQRLLLVGLDNGDVAAKLRHERPDLFACCVDVDGRSRTTREDARLAASWVRDHSLRSITVVTDKYHMPRALLELDAVMPDVEKIAYPVDVQAYDHAAQLPWLGREFAKFLASAAAHLFGFHATPHGTERGTQK